MNARVDPFANLAELPVFETKPKKEVPVAEETITRIAEANNFPSRQGPKAPVKESLRRKKRVYRTGRNAQINLKAKPQTVERFYKLADEREVALCKLLELALDALEREASSTSRHA
jgi:hypothetical protein